MTALLWFIQKIAPITNLVGLLVLLSEIAYGDIGIGTYVYVLAGALALAGFILGFTNWALDVPPKLFRPQSRVQLFDNRVSNAIGYAVIFFLLPFFVAGMAVMVGKL